MNAIKMNKSKKKGRSAEPVHQSTKSGISYMNGTSPASAKTLNPFYSMGPMLSLKGMVQPKLTIGQPNDRYEQEADRVADQVMRMPEPVGSLVNGHLSLGKREKESSLVQRQSRCLECVGEEEGPIQTKPIADQITPLVQRQVEEEEEEEEAAIQAKFQTWQGPLIQRQEEDEEEEPVQARQLSGKSSRVTPGFQNRILSLRGGGQSLPQSSRDFFESRFGTDFSQVRVHTNSQAAETAGSINAKAFTTGKDVVFNAGQYSPDTHTGKSLLAHELTHVLQQMKTKRRCNSLNGMRPVRNPEEHGERPPIRLYNRPKITLNRPSTHLSRAVLHVGALTIQIDYGNLISIPSTNYQNEIETRFSSWTGSPASTIQADLTALNPNQKEWVLFALDILVDNTTSAHSHLNRVNAVQRIIAYAPTSSFDPISTYNNFAREVLQVSGWFEVALAAPLSAPTGTTLTDITTLYNPPVSSELNAEALREELVIVLRAYLIRNDPNNWTSTGTHSLPTIQGISDLIKDEARSFFSPYGDTGMRNIYSSGWSYSANLHGSTPIQTDEIQIDDRINYLLNRAEVLGQDTSWGESIFSRVYFDSTRTADKRELLNIVTDMEADDTYRYKGSTIRDIVNRIIQQTGRAYSSGATRQVSIPIEYNASNLSECQARWDAIDTLSHELVHVMVHPNFPSKDDSIKFGQIVREGFTEVLGVQLYNQRLRDKAQSNPTFKAQMEAGLPGACPEIRSAHIGYGEAGSRAEQIRLMVTDENFRAAYFLGATYLVGL